MRVLLVIVLVGIFVSPVSALDWQVAEIGGADSEQGPYQGGTVEFLGDDGFVITGTGGDIWSNKLGCTLAYVEGVSGDFTIQYTIEEHTTDPATTWSKCGVMIAQDVDPETPYVFLQSTCSNDPVALSDKGSKIITRAERAGGAGPGSNGFAPLQWPVTYQMVREGDLFTASVSFDGGATWMSVANPAESKEDTTTVVFTDPVIVGIAINGHNGGQTTGTARVTNIQITGGGLPTAVEPAGKLAATWGSLKSAR